MIKQLSVLFCLVMVANSLFSQVSMNMTKLGQWDENTIERNGVKYNDIWGYVDSEGNEYAVVGSPDKVHFIDVTDPNNPAQVEEFVGGSSTLWRDFKSYKTYVYGVADEGSEGLLVFDMSALPNGEIRLVNQISSDFTRSHNVFIDVPNGKLYLAGANGGGDLMVYDVGADPINPPLVGAPDLQGGGYVHDVFVQDNIAYCSHGNNGFYMWDMSTPDSPVYIDSRSTPGYNHSSWITPDGDYILYAEEVPSGQPLGILDISGAGNSGISEVTTFKFPLLAPNSTNSTPHNPFIIGDYAFVSYYEDGVQIMDISDPANPFLAAYYDTAPNNTSYNGTDRCWGVYPFFPSGNIIASDTEVGLVVLSTTLSFPTTCNDGVQNGIELGADCGGYCAACIFPPTANFGASITATCTGVIQFNDFSANGPTSWSWDFGDGATSTEQNPEHVYTQNGVYSVSLTISNSNGTDMAQISSFITVDIPDRPQVEGNHVCNAGSATLSAIATGDIEWFDANGGLLQSGNTFTTPNLNTTTTYQVQNVLSTSPEKVGPFDSTFGGGGYFDGNQSLVFEVYKAMTLKSVLVNAASNGNRTIIISGSNSFYLTKNVNITAGISRIDIDVELEPGTYQIGGNDMNLYRNNNGVNYPYELPGVMAITSSSAGGNFYYFFYDWEVQAEPCRSPKVPVVVTVSGNNPVADFTQSSGSLTVNFTDASAEASSWMWDFGDGNTSTLQNPSHTYASEGDYTVTLTVNNDCGDNTTSSTVSVLVNGIGLAENLSLFEVNPNPNSGVFSLELKGDPAKQLQLSIFDILGQQVLGQDYDFISGQLAQQLDLGDVANGTYLIRVTAEGKVSYKRMVVNK